MGMRFPCMTQLVSLAALASVLSLPPVLALEQPGFTGTWQRNEHESDDPEEKMRAAFEAMREQRGGRGGPGGRGGGTGRPGGMAPPEGMRPGGGGPRGKRGPGQEGPMNMMAAWDRIETTLRDGEFHVVTTEDEAVRIYYLDGKKHERQARNGMKIETRSEMTGIQISIDQKMEQGAEIHETYELSPDGARMIRTVHFKGRNLKEPIIIRTVYDAVDDLSSS